MFFGGMHKPSTTTPAADAHDVEPVSTTKALFLSVTIPRMHRVYLPPPVVHQAEENSFANAAPRGAAKSPIHRGGEASLGCDSGRITRETALFEGSDSGGPTRSTASSVRNPSSETRASVTVNLSEDTGSEPTGTWTERDLHYVEHEHSKKTGERVEDIMTTEEMATVIKLDALVEGDEDSTTENGGDCGMSFGAPKEETVFDSGCLDRNRTGKQSAVNNLETNSATGASSMLSNKIRSYVFGVVKKNEEEKPIAFLTREQSIAAIKECGSIRMVVDNDDKCVEPNTEIKVEALLRLTFRNLFTEGHFYNAPIYTAVESRADPDAEMEDWVEVAVMIKDPSVGIILERLDRIGVGSSVGTIAVYKAELCRSVGIPLPQHETEATSDTTADEKRDPLHAGGAGAGVTNNNESTFEDEWKVAASRLRVEQVKEQIHEQAHLSLDYISLLTVASILAGVGLITNSVVVIVASMLVSPIMGPVMGMTFGSRVSDWNLARWSFLHECFSLAVCFIVGFMIAMTSCWTNIAEEWPTDEMAGRGDTTGLLTGIAIAVPSGMGVALSILGNNTSSLVGVAISASLLPPAVNCGICWGYALLVRTGAVEDDSDADFIEIGGISFALTVVNIVCIWFSGMLMFAIKEVAPSKTKSAFWARDIKVARAIQKGTKEVNVEVIKAGLQSALDKNQQQKVEGVREQALMSDRPQMYQMPIKKVSSRNVGINFNLSDDPLPPVVMEEARRYKNSSRQLGRVYGYNFNMSDDPLPEADLMQNGLGYLANLLGLGEAAAVGETHAQTTSPVDGGAKRSHSSSQGSFSRR